MRLLVRSLSVCAALGLAATLASAQVNLKKLGTAATGIFDGAAAEIAAYDPATRRVFVTNADADRLDVIDIADPTKPVFLTPIAFNGLSPNSVAALKGMVAVALQANPSQNPGTVVRMDANGVEKARYTVGALPDMLTFTPDGKYILVANEGEPNTTYTNDPEGSISVIEVATGTVRTADFKAFSKNDLDPTIRIFGPNATVAQDLEPEYIAVAPDSKTAWVSLQEANAFAALDIVNAKIVAVVPAGLKDHSLPGFGLDASDRDNMVNIRNWPIFGMRMPDAIASYEANGETYYVTANEGDARDYQAFTEESRLSALTLDPTAFPDAAMLRNNANLARLTVTRVNGDVDGDGDYDAIWAYGGRGISIFKADGTLVWDSGDQFEQITASLFPQNFNASNDDNSRDNRSDNKGPEPEGISVATVGGRTYAFIALERIGGVMVYDVTNPAAPFYVTYTNNRDFTKDPESPEALDLGPESTVFVSAADSPNGKPLLIVPNEVSGTTTFYEVAAAEDVTEKVTVNVSRSLVRRTGSTFGFLTLRNETGDRIEGPLHVVFTNLPDGVELVNPSFVNGEGVGFTLPAPFDRDLNPNATIVVPGIEFRIRRGTAFRFDARVYAGAID